MDERYKKLQLTERQSLFVDAYLENGGNGAAAARTAGYPKKTANYHAHQLINKRKILLALEEVSKSDVLIAARDERQRFWTSLMRGTNKAGEILDVPVPLRIKASELLGKSQGDFLERITGGDGGPLEIKGVEKEKLDTAKDRLASMLVRRMNKGGE